MRPDVQKITKRAGIAGQVQIDAVVSYPEESEQTVSFVGSVYGGPIVSISPMGAQTFVTDPGRFGDTLTEDWVRRFLEAS